MKHSGKSTAGKIIAKSFSTAFFDVDKRIEELFFEDTGRSLSSREIYRIGRDVFRDYEKKAAEELSTREVFITVAAGGGICDNPEACRALEDFTWIFIDEAPRLLFERIKKGGIPPFLTSDDPYTEFLQLYNHRVKAYDKLSNIKITAGGRRQPEICLEIIEKLREAGYGRK